MANNIERMIADTFMEMAQGLETGSFGKRPKVALTGTVSYKHQTLPTIGSV